MSVLKKPVRARRGIRSRGETRRIADHNTPTEAVKPAKADVSNPQPTNQDLLHAINNGNDRLLNAMNNGNDRLLNAMNNGNDRLLNAMNEGNHRLLNAMNEGNHRLLNAMNEGNERLFEVLTTIANSLRNIQNPAQPANPQPGN